MRTTEMVLFVHFLKTSKFIPACISIYILSLLDIYIVSFIYLSIYIYRYRDITILITYIIPEKL